MNLRFWPLRRPGPVFRLSLGLVALIVSFVLALDLFFGLVPTRFENKRAVRDEVAGALGVQAATLLEQGEISAIDAAFARTLGRSRDVLSLALRRKSGELVAQTAQHAKHWDPPPAGKSTLNHVRVPLLSDGRSWGDLEVSFVRLDTSSWRDWMRQPLFLLALLLGTLGLAIVFLYMRRALVFLDPATAVPERVRQAFDTFVDAVAIVDVKGRLVLANDAFRRMTPEIAENLYGKPLADVKWLTADRVEGLPWMEALGSGRPVLGLEWNLPNVAGEARRGLLSCSPIVNTGGTTRGCLVTLHDVTDLQRANDQLREALLALEASRAEIEEKNAELQDLATRDSLTGCLNRRAFTEQARRLLQQCRSERRTMSCVMVDIDHFKSYNDRFGHSVGDRVIRLVASALMKELREVDLLCRYGGEEFCIILPDVGGRQARAIAERLRSSIESNVGRGLRMTESLVVTASLGATGLSPDMQQLDPLVDSADAALYEAKRTGRNRVVLAALHDAPANPAPQNA